MSDIAPGGEQWTITHGDHEAVLTEIGGTLRSYTVAGVPVVAGADAVGTGCRGWQLVPWPNRIGDGRYTWLGTQHHLTLTEPERQNAHHGLLAGRPWRPVTVSSTDPSPHPDRTELVLAARLDPQPGWDWTLEVEARWSLGEDGLSCTLSATNRSDGDAPFGYGAHPYLTVGEDRVDDVRLTVPATEYCEVDPERLLPTGPNVAASLRPVEGTTLDLRAGEVVGDRVLDTAMTGLPGRWAVRLEAERAVELWADADTFPWVQVFTGDTLPPAQRRTTGIAVEPLTCPPNAFATGEGVVRLAPGDTWTGTWGIRPVPAEG